jgi:hypothetical protein
MAADAAARKLRTAAYNGDHTTVTRLLSRAHAAADGPVGGALEVATAAGLHAIHISLPDPPAVLARAVVHERMTSPPRHR